MLLYNSISNSIFLNFLYHIITFIYIYPKLSLKVESWQSVMTDKQQAQMIHNYMFLFETPLLQIKRYCFEEQEIVGHHREGWNSEKYWSWDSICIQKWEDLRWDIWHSHIKFQGILHLFFGLHSHRSCTWGIHIHADITHIKNNKKSFVKPFNTINVLF